MPTLPNLALSPDQANYTSAPNSANPGVVSTQLDGGASRFRADQLGTSLVYTIQWTCNKKNYNYLMAFWRTAVNFGADPFTIDLILDSGDLQTYEAHFVPGTFGLTGQSGETYIVAASIEVLPEASYASGDAAILAAGPDV